MPIVRRTFIVDDKQTAYVFDVCRVEEHTDDAEVSDHPIERGSVITDNVVQKPNVINLDLIQSNCPIYDGKLGEVDVVTSLPIRVPEDVTVHGTVLTDRDRAEEAFLYVTALKKRAGIVKLYTPLLQDIQTLIVDRFGRFAFQEKEYVIKAISTKRDVDSRTIVAMSIQFREIDFVQTARVRVAATTETPVEDNGTKTSPEATEAEDEQGRSLFLQFTEKLQGKKMDDERRVDAEVE